jgi:hypothetical protein
VFQIARRPIKATIPYELLSLYFLEHLITTNGHTLSSPVERSRHKILATPTRQICQLKSQNFLGQEKKSRKILLKALARIFQLFKNAQNSVKTIKGSVYQFGCAPIAASDANLGNKKNKILKLQKEKKIYVKKARGKKMISDIENQGNSEQNEQSLVEMTPCNLPATIDMQTETSQHNLIMSSLQQKNDDGATGGSKKSGQPNRRVSFPVQNIVTGYFEASNPFAHIRTYSSKELLTIYQESCQHHETTPMVCVLDYLADLEVVEALCRSAVLNLRDQQLTSADCEALEAILKRVQFRIIDLNNCGLDDASASSLFDMIEYYEVSEFQIQIIVKKCVHSYRIP